MEKVDYQLTSSAVVEKSGGILIPYFYVNFFIMETFRIFFIPSVLKFFCVVPWYV